MLIVSSAAPSRVRSGGSNEWSLAPLSVRRIERVRLHADLTILAQLSGTSPERASNGSQRRLSA